MKFKKNINGQSLINFIKNEFRKIEDHRNMSDIPLSDFLMSGFAIFKMKMPSLLELDKHRTHDEYKVRQHNIKKIFQVENRIPSDTQLRDVLDRIPYDDFLPVFKKLFNILQNEKAIDQFKFHIPYIGDRYIVSYDGTGYFSSTKVRCDHCLVKKSISEDPDEDFLFHHQMLGASIVHPFKKTVLPFVPEPIFNEEGYYTKNDCEQAAAKRLYWRLKDEHPGLPFLLVADALHGDVPTLKHIKSKNWDCIIGVKPKRHKYLFEQFNEGLGVKQRVVVDEIGDKVKKRRTRTYRYQDGVYLTAGSLFTINVLDFVETIEWEGKRGPEKKKTHFTWMTTLDLNEHNVYQVMKAGRARWKEENEVFNTLKNQGYNLDHNYGHGKQYLSVNLAILMHLAFLTDQLEETFCEYYQDARKRKVTKRSMWEAFRHYFTFIELDGWKTLLKLMTKELTLEVNLIDTR